MMKKTYRGDCIGNPFRNVNQLSKIIDNSNEISKQTFLKNVELNEFMLYDYPIKQQMKKFPNDFTYYSYKGKIYFFTHSMVEHFFW